jgi:hypothetical protein
MEVSALDEELMLIIKVNAHIMMYNIFSIKIPLNV